MTPFHIEQLAMHLPRPEETEREHWTAEYEGEKYCFEKNGSMWEWADPDRPTLSSNCWVGFDESWGILERGQIVACCNGIGENVTKRYKACGLSGSTED